VLDSAANVVALRAFTVYYQETLVTKHLSRQKHLSFSISWEMYLSFKLQTWMQSEAFNELDCPSNH